MDRLYSAVVSGIYGFLWREALCRVETAAVTDPDVMRVVKDPMGIVYRNPGRSVTF